ncbi:MAG: hypothetical protein D6788_04385, partial [Planctomycetota bacterium]
MSIETLKLCGVLILLAPLAGAVLCGVLGPRWLKGRTHWPAILGVAGALAAAVVLFGQVRATGADAAAVTIPLYDWI